MQNQHAKKSVSFINSLLYISVYYIYIYIYIYIQILGFQDLENGTHF